MIYLYVATFQVEAGNDSRHCGPSFAFSCFFGHVLCWWFCLLFPAAVSSIFAGCPRGVSHRAGSPGGQMLGLSPLSFSCKPLPPYPPDFCAQASGRPSGACTHRGGGVGTRPTVVRSTAQPLGPSQACSATEGPRVAQLAVLHMGGPGGFLENALGERRTLMKSRSWRLEGGL